MTVKAWIATLATPLLVAAPVEAQNAPSLTWEPSLLIQLQVKDLDRSIRFYEGTLGFKITERRDDLQFAHVDCGLKGLQLGLSAGGTITPGAPAVVLNFGVTGDLEAARKALEAKGVARSARNRRTSSSSSGVSARLIGSNRCEWRQGPKGFRLLEGGHRDQERRDDRRH